MSSSRTGAPRQVPFPQGLAARPVGPNTRLISREALQGFVSWNPGALGPSSGAATAQTVTDALAAAAASTDLAEAAEPAPPEELFDAAELQAAIQVARQDGYQDGYRDGLVALESFKQSFALQLSAQLGELVASFGEEFDALERDIATSVARVATTLARQVVRSELVTRPELVVQVAAEAVNAVLMSADRIAVHVHPDDHALVAQGAADALAARGARLLPDAAVRRGGCRVDSDAGVVDARIETRWQQASQSLGTELPWQDAPEPSVDDAAT